MKLQNCQWVLHLAFIFIIIGGVFSHLFSKNGLVHLRKDGFIKSEIVIPFDIKLLDFDIEYYQGTNSPCNYFSKIVVNKSDTAIISMNNPYRFKGYCFTQYSFDNDFNGSILKVNYDFVGIGLVYLGFVLFIVGGLWCMISKKGLLKRIIKYYTIIIFFFLPNNLNAQSTISKNEADLFGKTLIFYNGRLAPIHTYATDFVKKIYGKNSFKELNSVQIMAGWIFYPQEWRCIKMIRVKDSDIQKYFNGDNYVSFNDLFDNNGDFKLYNLNFNEKGVSDIEEKISAIINLVNGNSLKIFPINDVFVSYKDNLGEISRNDSLFIGGFFQILGNSVVNNNHQETIDLISKLNVYQHNNSSSNISSSKINAEIFYNNMPLTKILFILNLTIGLISFIYFVIISIKNQNNKLNKYFRIYSAISSILIFCYWILRWYIQNNIPLSNGFETLIFTAYVTCIIGAIVNNKYSIITSGGLLMSGFMLLTANLSITNPKISSLMPVLHSSWLSIHVSIVMCSYSLFGLIFSVSLSALIIRFTSKKYNLIIPHLTKICKILLIPSEFLLGCGIISGSIWAEISWGSYWSWDPKETWALITFLVYGFIIHQHKIKFLKSNSSFHVCCIIGFLFVLTTYFGVNYIFGGLHGYN
ncbi:MAG: cytochrome c biogenesis protein CcsA [Bacteroidales bacterium]|nr:cytochrome c biogenesis protein CcsA [Bacteroidales bacterium]